MPKPKQIAVNYYINQFLLLLLLLNLVQLFSVHSNFTVVFA